MTVMGGIFVSDTWGWQKSGHAYLANVRDASWMDSGLTVIPMTATISMVEQWAVPYGRPDRLLPLLEPRWTPGDVTDRLAFFDSQGRLVNAALQQMSTAEPAHPAYFPDSTSNPQPGTFWLSLSASADALGFSLNQQVAGGGPLLAEVSSTSDATSHVTAESASTDAVSNPASAPYPIRSGDHTALVALPDADAPIGTVSISGLPAGATLCVSALTVMRPLRDQPDGSCRVVDRYGTWINPPTTAPCSPEPGK